MKIFRVLASIFIITVIAVIYVHQQVEIVKLSYAIDAKEKSLEGLSDAGQRLVFNLDHLTSPGSLEKILLAKKIELRYPNKEEVIAAAGRGRMPGGMVGLKLARAASKGIFANILELAGIGPEAHAKER